MSSHQTEVCCWYQISNLTASLRANFTQLIYFAELAQRPWGFYMEMKQNSSEFICIERSGCCHGLSLMSPQQPTQPAGTTTFFCLCSQHHSWIIILGLTWPVSTAMGASSQMSRISLSPPLSKRPKGRERGIMDNGCQFDWGLDYTWDISFLYNSCGT